MAKVIVHLRPEITQSFLALQDDETLARWLTQLDKDSAVKLARQIDEDRLTQLASSIPSQRYLQLTRAWSYSELNVGAYVTSAFGWVREDQTIADAISILRAQRRQNDAPLLVLDRGNHVLGWFDSENALLADSTDFVRRCVASVQPVLATSDVRATLVEFRAQREVWLPVIDVDAQPIGLLHQSKLPMVSWHASAKGHGMFMTVVDAMLDLMTGVLIAAFGQRQ